MAAPLLNSFLTQRRPAAAALLALVMATGFALTTAGCRDVVDSENRGTDAAFLRVPGEDRDPEDLPLKKGSIFPLTPGDRWVMQVQNKDKVTEEEVVVAAPGTIPGIKLEGPDEAAVEFERNGKAYHTEVYRLNSQGLWLLKAGSSGDMKTAVPPIPLVRFPIVDGDTLTWSGYLNSEKSEAMPGTAISRISGRTAIAVADGSYNCQRLDSIINTTEHGKPVSIPMTRWLAPGVGVVRQKLVVDSAIVLKTLKTHHVAADQK